LFEHQTVRLSRVHCICLDVMRENFEDFLKSRSGTGLEVMHSGAGPRTRPLNVKYM